jgi:hypothetical protein
MASQNPTTSTRKSASAKAAASTDASTTKRWLLAFAGLLLLILLAAWYAWPQSDVDRVRQMRDDLFATPREQMSQEERQEKFAALRAEQEKLSPEERQALRKEMAQGFQKKRNAEAVKYLAMTPEERQKVIDARLAREQAGQGQGGPPGGGRGGPGGPGGPGGRGAGNGPPGGGRGGGSPEERDTMRREMLLSATPQARAGMDQMRMDMAARRVELGLPPSSGRGFGRGN